MSKATKEDVPAMEGSGGESVGYFRQSDWYSQRGVVPRLLNSVEPTGSGRVVTMSLWTCCSR